MIGLRKKAAPKSYDKFPEIFPKFLVVRTKDKEPMTSKSVFKIANLVRAAGTDYKGKKPFIRRPLD